VTHLPQRVAGGWQDRANLLAATHYGRIGMDCDEVSYIFQNLSGNPVTISENNCNDCNLIFLTGQLYPNCSPVEWRFIQLSSILPWSPGINFIRK
jgi:hypothetical protein